MDARDLCRHEAQDAAMAMFEVMQDGGRDPGGAALHPARARALDACDRALRRIEADMAKLPPASAMAYARAFTLRKSATEYETNLALDKLAGMHAAERQVIEHARRIGVRCREFSRDEMLHYAFSLIRDSCNHMSFKDERDKPIEERQGYSILKLAISDWRNWLDGKESMLGNPAGPLRVVLDDADAHSATICAQTATAATRGLGGKARKGMSKGL